MIAIIAILAAMLLPAAAGARRQAYKTMCKSNLREWGIAMIMHAGDHEDFFPDNRDANGVGYAGTNMIKFWRDYLLRWDKTKEQKAWNHVLFCPTDKLHRDADLQPGLSENVPVFCGYHILPYQDVDRWRMAWDFKIAGIEGWHARTKFGGEFLRAPTVVDRIAGWGIANSADDVRVLSWRFRVGDDVFVPHSSHAGSRDVPEGGNFLFEDGHVTWYRFQTIALGTKAILEPSTYLYFYKIPISGP